MSSFPPPKNPFADPAIPSMDAILARIETDYQIPHQRRQDMCSAIRSLSKLFERPLSMIPASSDFLRRLFEGTHHIPAGLSVAHPVPWTQVCLTRRA